MGLEKLNASLSGAAFHLEPSAPAETWRRRYFEAVTDLEHRGPPETWPTPRQLAEEITLETGFDPSTAPPFDPVAATNHATGGAPFDVLAVTSLPESLIARLALAPGEDAALFTGDQPGWPNRRLPITTRPFLKLGDRYYAFETATFFDHIYHNLQEAVTGTDRRLVQRWEKQQQVDTEQAALDLLADLLPGGLKQGAFFYDYLDEESGETRFAEADGLLLYARHLLLVEVKGGGASHRAPSGSVGSYLSGVGRLVADPVAQAERFLRELARTNEIILRDEHRVLLGRISLNDFDQVQILAITLDAVGEVTANVQGQQVLRIGQQHSTWIINVTDLEIVHDMMVNPVQFLHFLEQRAAAQQVPSLQVFDELQHLSLYFKENRYALRYARENRYTDIFIEGLTDGFDLYYNMPLQENFRPSMPGQLLPELFAQVVATLAGSLSPEHVRAGKYLLDLPFDVRTGLERELHKQGKTRTAETVVLRGERPLTLTVRQSSSGEPEDVTVMNTALATMRVLREDHRLLLLDFGH